MGQRAKHPYISGEFDSTSSPMKGAVLEACDCVRKAQLEEGFGTYEDRFLTNQSHEIYEVTAAHLNTEDHVVEAMLDETDVAGTSAHKSRSAAT